jgi:hypothetical protein
MALPENEQAKDSRKRILKTEAAALALLLLLRRKTIKGRATAEAIAALEAQLYPTLAGIRQAARGEAFAHATKYFGDRLEQSGIPGKLIDLNRSKLYAGNTGKLGLDTLGKGGPVIKRIDQRLIQLAVTENSNAYNLEHRNAVIDLADHAGLVEVWDAELDKRTCDTCASLDGSEALNGEFEGGLVPGNVHTNCRCTSHFVHRSILH